MQEFVSYSYLADVAGIPDQSNTELYPNLFGLNLYLKNLNIIIGYQSKLIFS